MSLKEILEGEDLQNVYVHPIFDDMVEYSRQDIGDLFKEEEICLLGFENDKLKLGVSFLYDKNSYFVQGDVLLKDDTISLTGDSTVSLSVGFIQNQVKTYLHQLGYKAENIGEGVIVEEDNIITNLTFSYLQSSKGYEPRGKGNESIWKKLLGHEFTLSTLGLSSVFDMVNRIEYDIDSQVAENLNNHMKSFLKENKVNPFSKIMLQNGDTHAILKELSRCIGKSSEPSREINLQ